MKVPEAVRARFFGVLDELDDPEQALEAAVEQLREELESPDAQRNVAGNLNMAAHFYEGNAASWTAAAVKFALSSVLGEKT